MATKTFNRDDNYVPIANEGFLASKAITYVAETTGATGSTVLFTVTGDVLVRVFAVCGVDLDSNGAATIEVGITGNTAGVIALTTATTIDAGEIWKDATPATIISVPSSQVLTGTSIRQKITDAAIKAGKLTYYCLWNPVSSDGDITAA
jgi:hypothetical protein